MKTPVFVWRRTAPGHYRLDSGRAPIATITPETGGRYRVEYCWRDPDAGNKPTGWALRATVIGGKHWAERELNKFWNPPKVRA